MALGGRWHLRLGSLGLIGALVLAGCGGDPAPPDAQTPAPAASTPAGDGVTEPQDSPKRADPALAAYGKLLDADGRLSTASALRILAATGEPLPGVKPVLGKDAAGFVGPALRVLSRESGSLSPPVRTRVAAILSDVHGSDGVPTDPVEVEILPATQASGGAAAPVAMMPAVVPSVEQVRAEVEEISAAFTERSGHRIRLPIRVRIVPHTPGGAALTDALPVDRAPNRCVITLPHTLYDDPDALSIDSTVAHEVWHCFQFDYSPDSRAGNWVFEGQAEWAGEAHVGGSTSSTSRWDNWLLTNSTSLFRRSYDAIGLYAVAAQTGSDPWRTMLPMLNRGGNRAVATLFGSEPVDALRATAEALTREPSLGANWESTGPGITGAENSPVVSIAEGARHGLRIDTGPFGTMSVNLEVPEGDVLQVETTGGDAATLELQGVDALPMPGSGSVMFCLREGGCTCPDGSSPGGGDALPQARPGAGAASIGSLAGSHVRIGGSLESLEDACDEDVTGEWQADVGTVWAQLMRAYGGGAGGLRCDGTYFLTLAAEGAYNLRYVATCRLRDRAGRGRARLFGTYVAEEGRLNFTHQGGSGTFTMNGLTQPLPGLDAIRGSIVGSGSYVIEGNRMTVHSTIPGRGPIDIQWTRVG